MRGVTAGMTETQESTKISTHTPHARRDDTTTSRLPVLLRFLLTRLMRGVTELAVNFNSSETFLLTRLMRGVT